jgi:6-phosphogluconolactonase
LQSAGTEVFQNVTLVPLGLAAETASPSVFEIDESRRVLFAVNEIDELDSKLTGAISAFAIGAAGKLTLLNQRPSMGTRPCALARDRSGRFVLVAHCGSGTVSVFPVASDGRLGDPAHTGPASGQQAPCVAVDPESRFAFVCEPAAHRLAVYKLDAATGALTAQAPLTLDAQASPRQIVFRPDGRFAYVLNQRPSTVTVFAYDASTGRMTNVQDVSTVPEYFDGPNAGGELHIHRTGKWLYASNVGHNSVVLFTTDFEKGSLTFVEEQGTGGRHPQHFGIEPSSKHLAISNRDSNTVLASRIDEGNGRLKPSGIFADVPSPASIRFLPPLQITQ